jgi:capsular polysaccharide biosynthesis protein
MDEDKKDVPMIPKYQAESMIMHMSRALKYIVIVSAVFAAAMVAAIIIFVNGYTSRTKDWLNTLAGMQQNPAVTEVTDGIQQQSDP